MSHQPTNRIKNKFANDEHPPTLTLLPEPEELEIGEAFDPMVNEWQRKLALASNTCDVDGFSERRQWQHGVSSRRRSSEVSMVVRGAKL